MRVLWIANLIFPEATAKLNGNKVLKSTGGWLLACAYELAKRDNLTLAVAGVSPDVQEMEIVNGDKIKFYIIPRGRGNYKYNKDYEKYWKLIIGDYKPDIVNIQGTEFPHSLSFLKLFPEITTILTIQGLSSQIAKFHNYGLTNTDILLNITPRDLIRNNLFQEKKKFESKGKCEIDIFKRVKYVIGRTSWDKAFSMGINSKLHYYHCNESLRVAFYSDCWAFNKCKPYTIFMSQAGSPFKGLHQLIKALPVVLREFPNTKVRIAGQDILRMGDWRMKIKLSGYGRFIQKLIREHDLSDKISFVGFLDEEEIKKELLSSNVYICPSSIENSPNSLCEAQMLGVPSIASYVGGIPDFIPNDKYGLLFRFEDVEMLSYHIKEVFNSSDSFDNTEMRTVAHCRHNLQMNVDVLMNIYREVIL